MMKPLTDEQRRIAEENHNLVYEFLKEKHLSESEYYDVVIFGYLCAAQEYCENQRMKRYSFSTLAWKRMQRELSNNRKYLARKSRAFQTIRLQDALLETEQSCSDASWIAREEAILEQLHTELFLHDLAPKLSRLQMRILCRKLDGARMHEIAKSEHLTFRQINLLLSDSYDAISQACYNPY